MVVVEAPCIASAFVAESGRGRAQDLCEIFAIEDHNRTRGGIIRTASHFWEAQYDLILSSDLKLKGFKGEMKRRDGKILARFLGRTGSPSSPDCLEGIQYDRTWPFSGSRKNGSSNGNTEYLFICNSH